MPAMTAAAASRNEPVWRNTVAAMKAPIMPAASRNNRMPSCRPFKACTSISFVDISVHLLPTAATDVLAARFTS
ncbi:hypothetical protein G6F55_014644 [Rhizopus delemar]|nr:hypothetical protein G6F55_014644 [Rhizopus delemar]